MWTLVATAVVACLAAWLGTVYVAKLRYRQYPGPWPQPLLGNAALVKRAGGLLHDAYHTQAKRFGDVFLFFLGSEPVLVISDCTIAKEIMVRQFRHFHDRPIPPIIAPAKRAAAIKASILNARAPAHMFGAAATNTIMRNRDANGAEAVNFDGALNSVDVCERTVKLFIKLNSPVRLRGDLWTTLRAASQPVFHADSLRRYADIMNEAADAMVTRIGKAAASATTFDLGAVTGRMTMRVILQCALGVDVRDELDASGNEHPAISASKTFFQRATFSTIWTLLIMSLPAFLHPLACRVALVWGDFKELNHARDIFFALTDQLVRSFCKAHGLPVFPKDLELLGKGATMQIFPEDTVPSEDSIIAAMMRATTRDTGRALQSCEVLQQANTFLAAGYETTSVAVQYTVYLLARHPDVEAKLLREIDAQGKEKQPTYDTLENWPYARMRSMQPDTWRLIRQPQQSCFREALRLFPVAPIVPRYCVESTTVSGRRIPRGTSIHVNVWQMHHNPEYFPDPEAFKPERFIEAAAGGSPDLHPAYLSFGAGPRNCIGARMALEEGTIMVIRLYQKFVFRLSEANHPGGALPLKMGITLAPKNGLWVTAVPR